MPGSRRILVTASPESLRRVTEARARLAEARRALIGAERWKTPGRLAAAIDPATVQTPALDLIDEALVDAFSTPGARLIVSMSPQEGKSERVTKTGSLWALTRNPETRIGIVSYSQALAEGFSRTVRNWVTTFNGDEGTLNLGLRVARDNGSVRRWQLDGHRGGVIAAGIGSGLTGRPLDCLVIDDPVADKEQAESSYYRERVWDWWQSVGSTRLAPGAPAIVILTRWHCLLPGSDILTSVGIASVEGISAGTTVITSAGAQQVIAAATRHHRGDVVSLCTYGYPRPLKVTPEHRILTAEGWREAGQLRAMDWLVFPIPQGETSLDDLRAMLPAAPKSKAAGVSRLTGERLPVTREALKEHLDAGLTYQQVADLYGRKNRAAAYGWALHYGLTRPADNVMTGDPAADPDFWRVVGYWLAEGDITAGRTGGKRNVVRWTFGHDEDDLVSDVAAVLARYGLTIHTSRSERLRSISARCSSAQLAAFLDTCGHRAENKRLPESFVTLPGHLARELVRGYWLGDGCFTAPGGTMNDGWARIASISVGLLMGFYRLLPRLGIAASIMKTGKASGPLHELRFPMCDAPWLGHAARPLRQHSVRIDGDRLLVKIKRIAVEEYDGPVYDIQTPAHDFVANNFTVHNCDDLAGRLIGAEDGNRWRVINIPALADHDPAKGQSDPLGREPGEWLTSARGRTVAEWEQIRIQAGSRVFAALYQGRPSPDQGNVWQRQWWRRYLEPLWSQHPDRPDAYIVRDVDEVVMSWDMTFSDSKGSDYVAGQVLARRGADVFLLDQVHKRLSFTDTLVAFQALVNRWPQANRKIIEDKANGPAVVSSLKSKIPGIVTHTPKGSKYARATAVAPFIEAGNVLLPAPEIALFDTEAFVDQAASFPNDSHDDQVDALSQGLAELLLDGNGAAAWIAWAKRKAEQAAGGAPELRVVREPEPEAAPETPPVPLDPVAARQAARNAMFRAMR